MATRQIAEPIDVTPPPVASTQQRRRRRHRLLKVAIILTVPFYCIGFSLLAMLRIEAMLDQIASSPMFLAGLVFFIFLLLLEPFTGAMTHSCTVGAKCASVGAADPVSCLTVIGVVAGLVTLAIWLF